MLREYKYKTKLLKYDVFNREFYFLTEFSESLHGRAINQCAKKLVTDMAVDDVIDRLQSKSILTDQMINKIQV